MRIFLLIALGIAALWDYFATVYGTILILGDGLAQILVSVVFGVLILGFSINTIPIFRLPPTFVGILIRIFWFVAICYDFYTSWLANSDLLTSGEGGFAENFVLLGVTLMVTISPILLMALWQYQESDTSQVQ